MTRHPELGAVERRLALLVNHREIRNLEKLRRSGAPEVPICELVDFSIFLASCYCARAREREGAHGEASFPQEIHRHKSERGRIRSSLKRWPEAGR
jgi:hypothetical protein